MRTLPNDLLEAQQRAPLEWPKVRVRIKKTIGGVRRLDFDRVYEGIEPDGVHCAVIPSDGSFNRFRIDPADSKLHRQRVPNPENPPSHPTFGNPTPGNSYAILDHDTKHASKFTLSDDDTVVGLKIYCRAWFGFVKAKAAIYADSAGAPGALLATSQEVTGIDTTPAWRGFSFATSVELTAGTYWLGFIIGDEALRVYYTEGDPNQSATNIDTYSDGPSDPFGTPSTYDDYSLSICALFPGWAEWIDTGETAARIACTYHGLSSTFGFDGGDTSLTPIQADHKSASKFTLVADKDVTSIVVHGKADTGTCKAKALIYADSAGAPGALLATSEELTDIDTSDTPHTFPFTTPVELTAGTYWLGFIIGDNTFQCHKAAGSSNQRANNVDTYSDGPSDPFGADPDYDDEQLYIYATVKSDVLLAFLDNNSPYHVYVMQSPDNGETWGSKVDTGAVSTFYGRIALAAKADGTTVLFYVRSALLYARKRSSGVWGNENASGYAARGIKDLAALYMADYNFVLTGTDPNARPGLWRGIYGDGYSQSPDTWSGLSPIMLRESTEPFQYVAPFLTHFDVFRCFFVERYTDSVAQDRVFFTYTPATADWVDNLWREPIPFDLQTLYGMAVSYHAQTVWLSTPSGIWKASTQLQEWDITGKIVEIWETDAPYRYRSWFKVILDNTAGLFNDFHHLGYEITFGKGYLTASGPLYSEGSSFWITGWRFVSPPWFPLRMIYPAGVIGTLEIHCEGFWDLSLRYKFRRQISWPAGETPCLEILSWLLARLGFELNSTDASPEASQLYPPLTIKAGTKAYTVIKKILSWLPDTLMQRGHTLYLLNLDPSDPVDYDYSNFYGVSHVVYRGNYGIATPDPNRAQVWTDTFMAEAFGFDSIQQVYDRLVTRNTPEYAIIPNAALRAAAELRKGEVSAAAPGWLQVPTNCGQEPADIITISDSTAGVSDIKRRVLGIRTHWRTPFLWQQVFELGAP